MKIKIILFIFAVCFFTAKGEEFWLTVKFKSDSAAMQISSPAFQNILSKYTVKEDGFKPALPGAKNPELLLYYTMRCSGNSDEVIRELNATGLFSDIEKDELVVIDDLIPSDPADNPQTAFAPIGAEWYFLAGIGMTCDTYTVEKDTVIEGKTCSVVGNSITAEKQYLYQEDSKVYLRYNNAFHKVFDFTVEVGDSVQLAGMLGYVDSLATLNCKVYSMDIIRDNNGMPLKRIFVRYPRSGGYAGWYSYAEKIGTVNSYGDCFACDPNHGYIIPRIYMNVLDIEYSELQIFLYGDNLLIAYKDNAMTFVNVMKDKHSNVLCDFPGKETAVVGADYSSVKIFPNPVNDMLEIQYLNDAAGISLTDIFGRVIRQYKINPSNLKIDVSFLPAGIYFCKIYNSDSLLLTHKIIKV